MKSYNWSVNTFTLFLVLILLSGCSKGLAKWVPETATHTSFPATSTESQQPNENVGLEVDKTLTQTLETPVPSITASITQSAPTFEIITPGPSLTSSKTIPPTMTPRNTKTSTPTPTITNTPTPPFAYLQIKKPGDLSKVVSPINIESMIIPGEDGLLRVDLIGEDGRIVAHQDLDYSYASGNRFWTSPKLSFEIVAAAELGRLQLTVYDKFSRLIALSSVDIFLQAMGRNVIKTSSRLKEAFIIRYPYQDLSVQGGIVYVNGLASPINDSPVIFELIDEYRNIVGSSVMIIPFPEGELSHSHFTIQIPYQVYATTDVRLTIRQESTTRIPGTIALSSMRIILEP